MFRIQGAVTGTEAGVGFFGLTVVAVDTLEGTPAVMVSSATAEDGTFTLDLEMSDVLHLFRSAREAEEAAELGHDATAETEETSVERDVTSGTEGEVLGRRVALHVYVLQDATTLARQRLMLSIRDLLDGTHCIEIRVDTEGARGETTRFDTGGRVGCRYFVRGHLRQADGMLVASSRIEVVEQRLRHQILLGTARTDPSGAFVVAYGSQPPCDRARPGKSLFVRAVDAQGEESARSRLYCDVPAEVTIDLVVGDAEAEVRGPSLYVQVWQAIAPRLEGAVLHELDADDVEFLACSTRQDMLQVAYLARSAQLEERTGVTRVAFFAFANAGLPTTLVGILGQSRETQALALQTGERDNIDLEHVQRLHAIAPRFGRGDAVTALLAENILSAQQICKMGYSAFTQKLSEVRESREGTTMSRVQGEITSACGGVRAARSRDASRSELGRDRSFRSGRRRLGGRAGSLVRRRDSGQPASGAARRMKSIFESHGLVRVARGGRRT